MGANRYGPAFWVNDTNPVAQPIYGDFRMVGRRGNRQAVATIDTEALIADRFEEERIRPAIQSAEQPLERANSLFYQEDEDE